MMHMSKLCDAADWFAPDIVAIIKDDLKEPARFHRKQWEFAMILSALQQHGKLAPRMNGLSMGGGKERVLYSIAQYIGKLVVTDLYETNTTWDCAKTEDPESFIKSDPPFPVDLDRIQAQRMDMRHLEFPDRSFDFCYSTCAVEHIGREEDFVRHFNEVARVLKDDGVYIMTTEVTCTATTIRDPHNYVFALDDLFSLIYQSDLLPAEDFNAHVTDHWINRPIPSNARNLSFEPDGHYVRRLFEEAPHLHLLRGKYPFTCGLFVLRKRQGGAYQSRRTMNIEATRTMMESAVEEYRYHVEKSTCTLNPFSLLPGESSRFFTDHAEFFTQNTQPAADVETVFHTDYFWLGSGVRAFEIALEVAGDGTFDDATIEFRIHRYPTLASENVECVKDMRVWIPPVGKVHQSLTVNVEDDFCYAILAKMKRGRRNFTHITITSSPAPVRQPVAVPANRTEGIVA
jgi:SAM-dependent methyltransferase